MTGYLGDPDATTATIDRRGWLHTGNLARFDTAGDLFLVDRLKELIKTKGFRSPQPKLEATSSQTIPP